MLKPRAYQRSAHRSLKDKRFFCLLWRRQGGKSSWVSRASNWVLMKYPGVTCVYCSASLLLGREIIYKDTQIWAEAIREAADQATAAKLRFQTTDRETGKDVSGIDVDGLADLFESQKLEFRLYHDQTRYSRTQVIAPNPATARGWTGWVFIDEFGFIKNFADLWEAVEPIVSSDRNFHCILATTPPSDDAHYSYELTAPPLGMEFPVNAEGNWYVSESGVDVHRVDIHDAYAAGQKLYDLKSGAELSPQEHFSRAHDKDAWRRNYGVLHVLGGTAACGLLQLDTAQRRGIGRCACIQVDSEMDFDRALVFLREHIGSGPVGLGWDLATTEKETSNPSSFTVMEREGTDLKGVLTVTWKTSDPALATERARRIVQTVNARPEGGRARRLCVDATNERFFATQVRRDFSALVPVELIIGSETIQVPGAEAPLTMKAHLGGLLVAELDDNHLTLPAERYLKEDFRLVRRDRGSFACEPAADGKHGDVFDSHKLGLWALKSTAGGLTTTAGIRYAGQKPGVRQATYRPLKLKRVLA